MLPDGRMFAAGGHNLNSQNGYKKTQIFDMTTGLWDARPIPVIRAAWDEDPFGKAFFSGGLSPFNTIPYPLAKASIDPPHSTDMTYERWYPTVITLPNGWVFIVSGHDKDETVPPDNPTGDAAFDATSIIQAVPEVVRFKPDGTIKDVTPLENSRMVTPAYSRVHVVQRSPMSSKWDVCVIDTNPADPSEASSDPAATASPGDDIRFHGGATGQTSCIDVKAAFNDPKRDIPKEKQWKVSLITPVRLLT